MPLNYRKNNLTLTSEYYDNITDLNGPGICQDHRLNLVFENQKRYIGLVDSNHEQASDLTVNIEGKNLRLAKKSKYAAGEIDYEYNFKGIGFPQPSNDINFFGNNFINGKIEYQEDEFVSLINDKKVDKIYESYELFSVVNYKDQNQNNKAVYWNKNTNDSYINFPFNISKYITNDYSDYNFVVSEDNKLYAWKNSSASCAELNIEEGDIINLNDEKVNSFESLTNLFSECNILISNVSGSPDGILLIDVNNKLYGWGKNIRNVGQNQFGVDKSADPNSLVSIMPDNTFKSICANNFKSTCSYYALDSNDLLYVWGHNTNSKLGISEDNFGYISTPTLVGESLNFTIDSLVMQSERTIALSKNKKRLYVWGKEVSLDITTAETVLFPEIKATMNVDDPNAFFSHIGVFIDGIAYVITGDNKVYLWGRNERVNFSLKGLELSISDFNTGVYDKNWNNTAYAFKGLTRILTNFNVKKINYPYFLTTDNKLYRIPYHNEYVTSQADALPPYLIKENVLDFYTSDDNLFIIDTQNNLLGSGDNRKSQLLRKTWAYPFKNIDTFNNSNLKKVISFERDSLFSVSKDGYLLYNLKPISFFANLENSSQMNESDRNRFLLQAKNLFLTGCFEFKNKKIKDFFTIYNGISQLEGNYPAPVNVFLDEDGKYTAISLKNMNDFNNNINEYSYIFSNDVNNKINKIEIFQDGKKIKKTSGNVILTDSNELFIFSGMINNDNGDITGFAVQKLNNSENINFIDISSSMMGQSILALSENKKMYMWKIEASENNLDPDQPVGEIPPYTLLFSCIRHDCNFKHISSEMMFSTAIGEDGKLYTWGMNYNWQLGVDPASCITLTTRKYWWSDETYTIEEPLFESQDLINLMPQCKFIYSTAVGNINGMAIDCNNNLYQWGTGTFSTKNASETSQIKKLDYILNPDKKYDIYSISGINILSEESKTESEGYWEPLIVN